MWVSNHNYEYELIPDSCEAIEREKDYYTGLLDSKGNPIYKPVERIGFKLYGRNYSTR